MISCALNRYDMRLVSEQLKECSGQLEAKGTASKVKLLYMNNLQHKGFMKASGSISERRPIQYDLKCNHMTKKV